MTRTLHKGSVIPPLLVVVLGAAALAAAMTTRKGMLPNDPGPAFLPMIVGVGLIGMGLYLLFDREPHDGLPGSAGLMRVAGTVLLTGFYLYAIRPIGFPAATALFLAGQMWVIGVRNPVNLVVTPILLSAAIYVTFRYGLDVPLPATRIMGVVI